MNIDAAILIALGGVITAAIAIFPALSAYQQTQANTKKIESEAQRVAHRDEVNLLREEVSRLGGRVDELSRANARLQDENSILHRQIIALQSENAWLRNQLRIAGLEIPTVPDEIRNLYVYVESVPRPDELGG